MKLWQVVLSHVEVSHRPFHICRYVIAETKQDAISMAKNSISKRINKTHDISKVECLGDALSSTVFNGGKIWL